MKKKKILIVEDEAIFRSAMEEALKQDFEISSGLNGKEGLKLVKEVKPDLVLLDILMPDMNGLEVLKKIKEDEATKDIDVVLLTNVEKDESISEGVALGAKGYLLKGDYTLDEIVDNVRKLV